MTNKTSKHPNPDTYPLLSQKIDNKIAEIQEFLKNEITVSNIKKYYSEGWRDALKWVKSQLKEKDHEKQTKMENNSI